MDKYIYSLEIKVRDYELDCEGIVNNANYLHYLEHTRHQFCEWAGFPFSKMQEQGLIPVLSRVEIDYKTPLRSGDVMDSKLWIETKGPRFVFHQDIINKNTGQPAVKAIVSVVFIQDGRLSRGEIITEAFKEYLNRE